jgi:tetratricopeptide (TPR) repeat protein
MVMKNGVNSEARELIDEAIKKTGEKLIKCAVQINMYEKNYYEAMKLVESSNLTDYELSGEKYMLMAKLNLVLNKPADALKNFESARLIISQAVKNKPESCYSRSMLALAYAGLGNKDKAIEESETAVKIAYMKNRVDESEAMMYRAQVYVMLGQYDDAFPIVIYLLNNPSYLSKKLLQLDPVWIPLLEQSEYKKKLR